MTEYDERTVRNAVFSAYLNHHGGDESDPDDQAEATEFANAVMALLAGEIDRD